MGESSNSLGCLSVKTSQLNMLILQDTLSFLHSSRRTMANNKEVDEIIKLLWLHLQNGLSSVDDQLLCATCFYNALTVVENKEIYLEDVIKIIEQEISDKCLDVVDNINILRALSLMYGLFQSSLLTSFVQDDIPQLKHVLIKIFNLLVSMANEYTQYTFIVFKTIASFRKVCRSTLKETLFCKDNQLVLLNLVCHNWENPITGVRNLNKIIFQTLISVVDRHLYDDIIREINQFAWNKAKYLMLAEIILQLKKSISEVLAEYPDWIEGIVSSLYKPGWVSAGTDAYFAVLKLTKSEDEWCSIFLTKIAAVLTGKCFKAKENFNSYWCIATLNKYPNVLQLLYSEVINTDNSLSYSLLSLVKHGNMFGTIIINWDTMSDNDFLVTLIHNGVNYVDYHIRILAFSIVCFSQSIRMPTAAEYDLVYKFILNNINSDCTVLRVSMLDSLKLFLNQLHISYLHTTKDCDLSEFNTDSLYEFCKNMQMFIIKSITLQGNYQRKITTIKICEIMYSSLSEVLRKKKKNDKIISNHKTLIKLLKDNNAWHLSQENFITKLIMLLKDPAEDVKDNAVQLLFKHYATDLINLNLLDIIVEDALISIQSKFFYEVNCGQTMFKLIANCLIKHKITTSKFCNVEDMFMFVCNELINEHKCQHDVLKSIEIGRQLHAFVMILHTILHICLQNEYPVENMLKDEVLYPLLKTIEDISNQFHGDHDNATGSSDFSKMSDMVNTIIERSGYDTSNANDESKISGLHQIVLNTMWQNVKTSCELAAMLVKCYNDDKRIDVSHKCLEIIAHTLETSRHKGAIEAAGSALGRSIQHLTSLPSEVEMSKLPEKFLKCKLDDMICEANKMTSVTRRGAGLSIMVHRIVSSDMSKGKPLFHYFMKVLLEVCNKADNDTSSSDVINDNETDLPKAIYIHFLTRIVMDSTLASDIMHYSATLAEIAFKHLTNEKWQIRNAALQLYGALVPKLIGQKKSMGGDDDTVATVGCDEFRTHSTKLWVYMKQQLRTQPSANQIQSHSNLVPILNILANCARRYNFSFDLETQRDSDMDMFESFVTLLGSPLYTVRRLTSKCIFNIFSFELIFSTLSQIRSVKENFLHGSLLLAHVCYQFYHRKGMYRSELLLLKDVFGNAMRLQHSYLSRTIFDDMYLNVNLNIVENIEGTLLEVCNNRHAPGISVWGNTIIQRCLLVCSLQVIPKLLGIILTNNDIELFCQTLNKRLTTEMVIEKNILTEIVDILLKYSKKFDSEVIWQILYQLSLKDITIYDVIHIQIVYDYLRSNNFEISYKLRFIIPLAVRIIHGKNTSNDINLLNTVFALTNVEKDINIRHIAAIANNEFGKAFTNLSDNMKVIAITSAIVLLQDEDEEIRNISSNFYKNVTNNGNYLQPYICLQKLTEYDFLKDLFSNSKLSINSLCEELDVKIQEFSNTVKKDDYNPFANDSKNIYFESTNLKELLKSLSNQNK